MVTPAVSWFPEVLNVLMSAPVVRQASYRLMPNFKRCNADIVRRVLQAKKLYIGDSTINMNRRAQLFVEALLGLLS